MCEKPLKFNFKNWSGLKKPNKIIEIAKIFKIILFTPKNRKKIYKVIEIKLTIKKKDIKFVLNL